MKKLTSHNEDWNGTEIEVGSRLTLILGEPHQAGKFFRSLRIKGYLGPYFDPYWDAKPALNLYDSMVSGRDKSRDTDEENFDRVLEVKDIYLDYDVMFESLYRITSPNHQVVLDLPETNLSERLQVALIQEAIKSGKQLFIYTQSEVILLECMLGIKEGLLNLEEVKLHMVEGKEVIDVELLKGGRFKSFGDSFPGSVRSNQMKRYVGF